MRTEQIAQPRVGAGGGAADLAARLRAEPAGLAHPALWAALAALLAVFLLVPQLPLRYGFDVGREEGVGSDLPFLAGFNTAEAGELGSYRWTDDGARIALPGVGARPLLVRLNWLPTPAAVAGAAPTSYELLAGGLHLGSLPLRPEGGAQLVAVPAAAARGGALELTIRTGTFTLEGDPRRLAARLSGVEVVALGGSGPAAPDWGAILAWLGAVTLGWMATRGALGANQGGGFFHHEGREEREDRARTAVPASDGPARRMAKRAEGWAVVCLGAGATLVALAASLDPPRWAFGAGAALVACALAYPLALGARWALPRLAGRLGLPLDAATLGWLCLFIALSFGLRIGGRLYPDSMHGDIGFHHNRFNEMVWGLIAIVSVNRGVPFPYPPGPYAVVAPLTLLGLGPRALLQLGAALVDAASAAVVYAIAARAVGPRAALLAAGVYVFTAATFMTTWWSFQTHIYTQFFHLLLVAGLGMALAAWQRGDGRAGRAWAWGVAALMSLVFLGHFGFLINTALLLGLLAAAVWAASWRGAAWARRVRWPLTLAVGAAGVFAALVFYTGYIPMFLGQLETGREGGLTAEAGRGPVSRALMWERLWRDGLVVHFGLFPLLLMPAGLWLLARRARGEAGLGPRRALVWLMAASLAVAGVFAVFPFVAGVTNSPRWLMFIAWAVAVGSAVAAEALWRRGWWGRAATLAMGAAVLANTAWIWMGPMLWRIRPPEPF